MLFDGLEEISRKVAESKSLTIFAISIKRDKFPMYTVYTSRSVERRLAWWSQEEKHFGSAWSEQVTNGDKLIGMTSLEGQRSMEAKPRQRQEEICLLWRGRGGRGCQIG